MKLSKARKNKLTIVVFVVVLCTALINNKKLVACQIVSVDFSDRDLGALVDNNSKSILIISSKRFGIVDVFGVLYDGNYHIGDGKALRIGKYGWLLASNSGLQPSTVNAEWSYPYKKVQTQDGQIEFQLYNAGDGTPEGRLLVSASSDL